MNSALNLFLFISRDMAGTAQVFVVRHGVIATTVNSSLKWTSIELRYCGIWTTLYPAHQIAFAFYPTFEVTDRKPSCPRQLSTL
jgi:hypothetical protein